MIYNMQNINKAIEYVLNHKSFKTIFIKQGLSDTYYQVSCISINNLQPKEYNLTIDNISFHFIELPLRTLKRHIFYPDSLIIHLLQGSICIKDDLDIASSIYTINRNRKKTYSQLNDLTPIDPNILNIRISGFETIIDCRSIYIDTIEHVFKDIDNTVSSLIYFDEDNHKQPVCNVLFLQNNVNETTFNLLETNIVNHLLTMPYILNCNNFSIIPDITFSTGIRNILFSNYKLWSILSEISIIILNNYENQSQLFQTILYYFFKSLMTFEISQQSTICELTYNNACRNIIDSMNFHIINLNIIDNIRMSLLKIHQTFLINNISKIIDGLRFLNSFKTDNDVIFKHFVDLGEYLHKLDNKQTVSLLYSFIIQICPLKSELKPLIPYITSKIISHEIRF